MGISKTTFTASDGRKLVTAIPGTYAFINTQATAGQSFAPDRRVCFIAESTAGQGLKLQSFGDYEEAKRTLRSGNLLNGLYLGFTASPDIPVTELFTMSPNVNTQSTIDLDDTGATAVIQLDSVLYGTPANALSVEVTTGTDVGTTKVVIREGTDDVETIDNILYEAMSIQYTGNASTAVMTINITSLTVTLAGDQTDGSLDLSLNFVDYPTVRKIVDKINASTGYSASILQSGEELTEYLDAFTAEDITSEVKITQNIQNIIDLINLNSQKFTAKIKGSATLRKQLTYIPETFATGGTTGTVTATEWANLFTALEKEEVNIIVCAETSPTVILALVEHIKKMSTPEFKKYRQAFVGSATSDTKAQKKTLAALINRSDVCLFAHNTYDLNQYGRKVLRNGRDLACKAGGIASETPPNEPLTFKKITTLELSEILTSKEMNEYIQAGIVMLRPSEVGSGIMFLRSVSTFQGDNIQLNEYSIVRTEYYISRDRQLNIQRKLEDPALNRKTIIGDIRRLDEKRLSDYIQLGYLVVDNTGVQRTVSNYTLKVQGDKMIISSGLLVSAPVNFVFIDQQFDLLFQV